MDFTKEMHPQIVQKLKNNEARPKFTGSSVKKKRVDSDDQEIRKKIPPNFAKEVSYDMYNSQISVPQCAKKHFSCLLNKVAMFY